MSGGGWGWGASDGETQTEGSDLNHLKLLSLTHLVMGAKYQLGPQFLSVWASPSDFSTWLVWTFSHRGRWVPRSSVLRERTRWGFYSLLWYRFQGYFYCILMDWSELLRLAYFQRNRTKNPALNGGVSTSYYEEAKWDGIYCCGHLWKNIIYNDLN